MDKQKIQDALDWATDPSRSSFVDADPRKTYVEIIRKALEEKLNPWRSIESSPLKGKILLSFPCYKHAQIGWYNQPSNEFEIVESFKDKREPYVAPTHWMPLPQPPKESK
jgi:hypothetical protein